MPRFIGIDYGTRRIGLACGDEETGIAAPLGRIDARGGIHADARAVVDAAREYAPDTYVVGLPVNMDGTEGKQAKLSRDFGTALEKAGGKPVEYFDERLSSRAADELLQQTEMSARKKSARRDSVAAQVMLQCFLDARR